jgi:hypothetical protein
MDIDGNKRSVGSDGGYYDASDCTDADGDEKYDYGEDDGDEEEEDDDDDDVPFKLPDTGNFGVIFKQPDGQSTLEVRPNTDKGSGLDLTTQTTRRPLGGRAVDDLPPQTPRRNRKVREF